VTWPRLPKRSWILLLTTWVGVALLTKTVPESAHEFSRLGTVDSLVERGTYQLDDSIFIGTLDKILRDGHFYSHQPPLLATLESPAYWLLHLPGMRFNNRTRELTVFLFVVLTNGLALALTVVVFSHLLGLAGVPPPARDFYALVLPLGSWLLPYGVVANNHGVSGLLLAVTVYLLLAVEWRGATAAGCGWLGAVLGLLAAIELLPLVSFIPLTIGFLWMRRDVTGAHWRAFGLGLAVPLLAHSLINIQITGDVVPAGFHHELFDYPGSSFDETSLSGSVKHHSVGALTAYAWRALFAGKGYFTFAPVLGVGLIAGVAGWRWWARARGAHLVLLGGTLLSLFASLLMTNNFGGGAVGFRHATYLAPAMLTLLLPVLAGGGPGARAGRYAIGAAAALSLAMMLLFEVKQPWPNTTFPPAEIGTWQNYFPIVAKVVSGNLLNP
jgi:hypothetical protein